MQVGVLTRLLTVGVRVLFDFFAYAWDVFLLLVCLVQPWYESICLGLLKLFMLCSTFYAVFPFFSEEKWERKEVGVEGLGGVENFVQDVIYERGINKLYKKGKDIHRNTQAHTQNTRTLLLFCFVLLLFPFFCGECWPTWSHFSRIARLFSLDLCSSSVSPSDWIVNMLKSFNVFQVSGEYFVGPECLFVITSMRLSIKSVQSQMTGGNVCGCVYVCQNEVYTCSVLSFSLC